MLMTLQYFYVISNAAEGAFLTSEAKLIYLYKVFCLVIWIPPNIIFMHLIWKNL